MLVFLLCGFPIDKIKRDQAVKGRSQWELSHPVSIYSSSDALVRPSLSRSEMCDNTPLRLDQGVCSECGQIHFGPEKLFIDFIRKSGGVFLVSDEPYRFSVFTRRPALRIQRFKGVTERSAALKPSSIVCVCVLGGQRGAGFVCWLVEVNGISWL